LDASVDKAFSFAILTISSSKSTLCLIGERLNEVLLDEEIVNMAKENALSTLASKLDARLALTKMKYMKMLSFRVSNNIE
jgi:hypothetical protein